MVAQPVPASTAPQITPDLAVWMSEHGPELRRYFACRAPAAEAEDLVQDVFLRLQAARLGAPIGDAKRYLFAVARSVLVSRFRRRLVQGDSLQEPLEHAPEPVNPLSPERILLARQDYARAIQAMVELPPRARSAFRLHRFEALSYGAIADRMGISRDSVKELLRRANQRIGDAMRLTA